MGMSKSRGQSISGSRPFRETIWDVRKGKPNLKVFEDEVADVLQLTEEANVWRDGDHTSLVEDALDALLVALQQGDRLVLAHGSHVSLTTFGVLRAIGREAVLAALEKSDE
jgi:hypothetical protein